jgi:ribonucleoside-diphosphate reductase alpha chain
MNAQFITDKKRPVASMATLRADHPKILAFIRAKKHADFSKWRFNISVFLDEALMIAAEQQKPWYLKDNDGRIVSEINAALLLREIAEIAHYCGEPGILFRDRLEYDNPTPNWSYQSTAPCAELAMAPGDACQFSYLNLSHFVHRGSFNHVLFAESVQVLTRLLDDSVEYTLMQQHDAEIHLPLVREKRRIGVSITGFADLLIKLKVPYDHPHAAILAHQISELLDFNSKKASVTLAKLHGPFPCFSESRYQDHDWVRRKSSKTTGIVSSDDWHQLYQDIEQQGLRNATTTSIPPSGTSSTIANISKSLEPHFSFKGFNGNVIPLIEQVIQHHFRGKEQAKLMAHVAEHGNFPEWICLAWPFLRTSCQINPSTHLDIQQAFQSFLDDSVSKTINMHNKTNADDVEDIIWTSYKKGLKGVTIFRDNCLIERKIPQHTQRFFDQAPTPRDDKNDEVNFTI